MARQTTARDRGFRREFGSMLRERRMSLNLSQEELASSVNLTQATISNYENGRSEMPVSILVSVCERLQFRPEELLSIFRTPAY